jgi:hypothetical protein
VVAGLEPECTNAFLIAFADVATDSSLDSDEAVRLTLAGVQPGAQPIPRKVCT